MQNLGACFQAVIWFGLPLEILFSRFLGPGIRG